MKFEKDTMDEISKEKTESESEPQSLLMRLIAMAKKKKTQESQEADSRNSDKDEDLHKNQVLVSEKSNKVIHNVMMGKNNPIYMLQQKCAGYKPDATIDLPACDFMVNGEEPEPDARRAIQAIQHDVQMLLQNLTLQEVQREKDALLKPESQGEISPIPARCLIQPASNRMRAWGMILAPLYGGAQINTQMIQAELEKQQITFGINQSIINGIVSKKVYFKLFLVAEGRYSVDGQDGKIKDCFLRDMTVQFEENENKTVDYKNLTRIQKVDAGGTICDLIPPTDPISGINILGTAVQGREGKKAIAPKGKNTLVSEDELRLVAAVGGQVEFRNGQFHVEQLTTIQADVDNSTGNIDVIGNVVIKGDVREGFVVKATGDIIIKGKVEGAIIISGGNVQISMGMNGSLTGTLDAKGDIHTKYLENCTAHAGGCIFADSLVNSNVSSDRDITITMGLGAIIGGTVMAANQIEAKLIGNKSNRTTAIILGGTPGILKEKSELENELKRLMAGINELQKNLQYLGRANVLTPEYKRMQNDFKLQLTKLSLQQGKTQQRLTELAANLNPCNCRLVCKTIYPITQVTIGNATRILREQFYNSNIFYCDGEIRVGTK